MLLCPDSVHVAEWLRHLARSAARATAGQPRTASLYNGINHFVSAEPIRAAYRPRCGRLAEAPRPAAAGASDAAPAPAAAACEPPTGEAGHATPLRLSQRFSTPPPESLPWDFTEGLFEADITLLLARLYLHGPARRRHAARARRRVGGSSQPHQNADQLVGERCAGTLPALGAAPRPAATAQRAPLPHALHSEAVPPATARSCRIGPADGARLRALPFASTARLCGRTAERHEARAILLITEAKLASEAAAAGRLAAAGAL